MRKTDRQFWTGAELARLRELFPATPDHKIAELMGRSRASIRSAAQRLFLKKDRKLLNKYRKDHGSNQI